MPAPRAHRPRRGRLVLADHVSAFRAAAERRDLEALLGSLTPEVAWARARGFGSIRIAVMSLFGAALRGAISLADRVGARLMG